MDDKYLKGRAAMVTGGASGQGRAIALALAKAGAAVAIGSLTTRNAKPLPREDGYYPRADALETTRKELAALGVRAIACDLDVRSDDSVQAFHDAAVNAFGKVDILTNAAGICSEMPICGHTDEMWHKIIDVNLNGYYRTIKRCLPGMIERKWGRIVNIASTAASVGAKDNAAYCASKAAILGLTRCVALEGAPHGVSCNAISPGFVDTGMADLSIRSAAAMKGQTPEKFRAEAIAGLPQKRFIQPDEIGALAAFLCRDEAFGITTENITVAAGSLW